MRRRFVSSILLGMTGLVSVLTPGAHAQNYVPVENYNGPGIVVNLDVLGNANTGASLAPPPVYELPLPPPVRLEAPRPIQLHPPMMEQARIISAPKPPLSPSASLAPMPSVIESLPSSQPAAPSPMPAALPPPVKAVETPVAEKPVSDEMMAPPNVTRVPFSASDVAAISPRPVAPEKPVPAAPAEPLKPPAPVPEAVKPDADAQDPARTLLARAREEAGENDKVKRDVLLFDDTLAPAQKSTSSDATASSMPAHSVSVPSPVAPNAPVADLPPAMPPPVAKQSDKQVAMLKPAPLPPSLTMSAGEENDLKATTAKVDDFEAYRLLFGRDSSEVKPSEQAVLNSIVKKLKVEADTRLQLRAYAGGTPDTTALARRMSLARALNVRNYLVDQGITATRIDVRALGLGNAMMGDATGRKDIPADRVDLILVR